MSEGTESGAARWFLTKWCIVLAVVGVLMGFLLPFFKDSPPYP